MARAETANGSPWVFPGRKGKHIANPKEAWKRICTAAEVSNLHPHDLRRSLGSWMAGQNTSLPIIGRALGHKTAVATMVYSRLSLDPSARPWTGPPRRCSPPADKPGCWRPQRGTEARMGLSKQNSVDCRKQEPLHGT